MVMMVMVIMIKDKESTFSTFSVYAPATLVKSGADHYIGVARDIKQMACCKQSRSQMMNIIFQQVRGDMRAGEQFIKIGNKG